MHNDSIQMRIAVQMFIDFLLEHREQLQKAIDEQKLQGTKNTLTEVQSKQTKNTSGSASDSDSMS